VPLSENLELRLRARDGGTVHLEGSICSSFVDGAFASCQAILRDVTDRHRAQERERAASELLWVISRAQAEFIAGAELNPLFSRMLEHLLQLTGSQYGFIAEFLIGEDGAPALKMRALTGQPWDESAQRLYEAQETQGGLVFRNMKTLFGAVVTSGAPVVSNEPERDARSGGLPSGHPPLRAFLGLPFFKGSELAGVVGLANRPGGYDGQIITWLEPFLSTCAHLLQAHGVEQRRSAFEQALAENEARFRAVVDTAIDAIITQDEAGLIDTVNPAVERLFGYRSDELIGQNVRVLMPSPYSEEHDGHLSRFHESRQPHILGRRREAEARRKDGTTFPIELSVSEMRIGGRRMYTGIIRDITERKRVERLQSEFISIVSHELRTPLTSIRGSLGLLAGGVVGELSPAAREMIQIALTNGERLVRLINDILDVEKIQSGKMEFRPQPLEVGEVVRQAVEAHQGFALQHQTRFTLVGEPPRVRVLADADRLSQVMANLLSNAAKHSPPGEPVDVEVERREGQVRVSVRDRGPGIPAEFKSRVFERFAQADGSDTRRSGGTGLGLSISKAIIERLGGSIGFEPAPERGTRFFFCLPELDEPAPARVEGTGRTRRILVCEDDRDIALLIRKMLEAEGYQTDTAHTLAQARELLARERYDALTLDLMLGPEDGARLVRELRAQEATRHLPVVIVSARPEHGQRELAGVAVGIVDWITKPIDEQRLLAAVRTAVEGRGERRPRFLHVEDDASNRRIIQKLLADLGEVVPADSLEEARRHLGAERFDVVLLDLGLPDGSGHELLPLAQGTPVVIFSASEASADLARQVAAALVKARASEYQLREAISTLLRRR
jgi:PAS domain S-box-containing protein